MTRYRVWGAALVVAVCLPVYRLLDPSRGGPAAASTRAAAESAWNVTLYGAVLVVGLSFVLSRARPGQWLASRLAPITAAVAAPSAAAFALGTGLVALGLAAASAVVVHGALPTSVDEMAQLLHARAVASGSLTVAMEGSASSFVIQNGIVTPAGWASIYPPVHTLVLAGGILLGVPWIVGPIMLGVATAASTHAFDRLAGTTGRLAGALLAVTPFWILLGSTHLSHSTAAAGLALVLWTALRARDGGPVWAVATGAAIGFAVAARPWVSLVCATALLSALWLPRGSAPGGARACLRRFGGVVAGGLPFALLLFWWNARLFGSPTTLGYSAAFGPAHGLGLHRDPWGNLYGVREAVAYTGADLVQLGAQLLLSPMSALVVVGLGLLVREAAAPPTDARASSREHDLLAVGSAWAVAAVAANALYWHHGAHFGPRMLLESVPAWAALFTLASARLVRRAEMRGMGAWIVTLTLVGAAVLAPGAVATHVGATAGGQPAIPEPPSEEPAVIFVHGSWASRVGARLAAAGMRRDSIETALRRNDLCAVDLYARWRSGDARGAAPPLDLESLPGSPTTLQARQLSPGNFGRFATNGPRDATCEREARSDRLGVQELEPLLWRAAPPGAAAITARDLGPAANAVLLQDLRRPAFVYVAGDATGDGPRLLRYGVGMELLWRGAAGTDP